MTENTMNIESGDYGFPTEQGVASTGSPNIKWDLGLVTVHMNGQTASFPIYAWTYKKASGKFAGLRAAAHSVKTRGLRYLVNNFFVENPQGKQWKRLLPIKTINGQKVYTVSFSYAEPRTGEVKSIDTMVQVDAVKTQRQAAYALAKQLADYILFPIWAETRTPQTEDIPVPEELAN
jgi:hypothetical protein